ncbi:MAG: HAD family hydrolase [Parcubacteria group bacterium]|nr:HAD family hydrolase [Parcubacteria group bacterium]
MNKGNLIIFDFDGVIFDSIETFKDIYNKIHRKYNLPRAKSKKYISDLFSKNIFEKLKKIGLTQKKIEQLINEVKISFEKKEDRNKIFDGISKAIIKIKQNDNSLAIVTSNHRETVESFLKNHHLNKYFNLILGSESGFNKSKKINLAIKRLNSFKKYVYFISDTAGDIIEGKKVDVKTIAVTWGYNDRDMLSKANPDFICDNPKDLYKIINPYI